MLSPHDHHTLSALSGEDLAEDPRTQEEIDFWFTVGPKRRRWKASETNEWRLRLAIRGATENRALLLEPFLHKKPSRVDFNTAHVAAVLGTVEALELARTRKADFSAVWLKQTSFSIAAKLGHLEFVNRLLEDDAPYVITKGNFGGRISPLSRAITAGHRAVVHALKAKAIPEDIATAIGRGDVETMRLLKPIVPLPDRFSCCDEATAMAVLELFPDVPPVNLVCNTTPVGVALAEAIVAKHPALLPEEIAPHCARMSVEGLGVLFTACKSLGKKFSQSGEKTSLSGVALSSDRVEVLRELVDRGVKLTGVKSALKDRDHSNEMLSFLAGLKGPQSQKSFFDNPFADGFKGRFLESFFGMEFGKKQDKSIKVAGLSVTRKSGIVSKLEYSAYDIPGDAFEVISTDLDTRFSARILDRDSFRTWSGAGLSVTLMQEMTDPGLKLTLTVMPGETTAVEVTPELLQRLKDEFSSTFDELENVSVEHGNGVFTFAGNKADSDAGVLVTWPRSPLDAEGGFESAFVSRVCDDLRDSEDLWDDEPDC